MGEQGKLFYDRVARYKLIKNAPAEKKIIKKPGDCPWGGKYSCEYCKTGERTEVSLQPLGRTIYDVAGCYKKVAYEELISRSGLTGIELQHTFEKAHIDKQNEKLFRRLKSYNPSLGEGLYISAIKTADNPLGNGTGKSYALHALTHQLCRNGIKCLYSRTVDFLMELRAALDDGTQESESKVLRRYTHIPVLLWDDLGKENFRSEWAPEKFYYVIDYRVRTKRPLILSSNFDLPEIEARFGIDNYGPAIASRLAGCCETWKLGGADRRIRKNKAKEKGGQQC